MDKTFKSKLYYNISLCYYFQNLYSNALFYAKSAKDLYLKEHKWARVGDSYNLIAVIYRKINDLSQSEKYIQRGFDIANESPLLLSKLHHNFALLHRDRGDLDKAQSNIRKSIALKESLNTPDLFISYLVLLNILLKIEDIHSIKTPLKQIIKLAVTPLEVGQVIYIRAQLEFLNNNSCTYEKLISESIQVFLVYEEWEYLEKATEHYTLYLEMTGKYKKALQQQQLCNLALKKIYWGK